MAVLEVAPHRAIQDLESDLGITSETLASALGVDKRSVQRWRAGGDYPRIRARQALGDLYALHNQLLDTFTPEDAQRWLVADSEYLGGMAPIDALRAGRMDRVRDALDALESGVFL